MAKQQITGRPRTKPPISTADLALLTPEDQKRLREEAQIKVKAERKLAAEEAFLEQVEREERRGVGLEESQHTFTLDLPLYADRITIDGVVYFHAQTYTVGLGAFNSMREMQARMWRHQAEIDGKATDFYRKQVNTVLSPRAYAGAA